MAEIDDDAPQEPERPPRRWLRRLVIGASLALVSLFIVVIALRLYFNDERLRQMVVSMASERTGTEVTLGDLDLRLFSGLVLNDLVVGPPDGFERNVLELGHLSVRYDPWAIFAWVAHITEIEIRDVAVTQERLESGETNVAAILAHLSPAAETRPPEKPAAAPPAPPPQPQPALPPLPALPIDVRVDSLTVGPVRATLADPSQSLSLGGYRTEARFAGQADRYDLELWTGLGPRGEGPSDSDLTLTRDDRIVLSSRQKLSVDLRFAGYESIGVSLRWNATTDAEDPIDAPAVTSRAELDATADLLQARAEVSNLQLAIGEDTELVGEARAAQLLSDPALSIAKLELRSVLDELEPVARAVLPSAELGGVLRASVSPTELARSQASDLDALDTGVRLDLEEVRAGVGSHRVRGLSGELRVDVAEDRARAQASLAASEARSGAFTVTNLGLELQGQSAVARWVVPRDIAPDGTAIFGAQATMTLGTIEGPDLSATGLRTRLDVSGPVDLPRGGRADSPLQIRVDQRVRRVAVPGQRVSSAGLRAKVDLLDVTGNNLDADLTLNVASIRSQLGDGGTIDVPPLTSRLRASRRGQRLEVPVFLARIGDTFALDGKLTADRVFTGTPRVERAELYLTPFDVRAALALLPESTRPAQEIRGTLSLEAELEGRIPLATLARATTPPKLGATLTETVDGISLTLERTAQLFESGLPFTGRVGVDLNDARFSDSNTDVDGLSVDLDLNILETGPRLEVASLMRAMNRPAQVSELSLNGAFGFKGRTVTTNGLVRIGSYLGTALPEPVRAASGEWRLTYEVGGALALEQLEIVAPDRDGRLSASMIVQEPLKVVRDRRYAFAGMPGVDASARFDGNLRIDQSAPLEVPGLALDGAFGLNGELRIADGLIDFTGIAFSDHLSLANAAAVLTDIDGGIPFELRFATLDREGFVAMPQAVPFGDGTLRIQVERAVRLASARPLYFERIRRYRAGSGIKIRRIETQGFVIDHLELDGGVRNAGVVAERARLSILGGDISGSLVMRISGEREIAGNMDMKISNIDASTFGALDLKPGRASEVDADASIRFGFSEDRRDLTANMNVTRISSTALDRFLQLLDPEEENQSIQGTRFWLNLAQINGVAMWLAYENLNMDLDANSIIKIPFTSVGFPSFERELLRREPMGERLDIMLDPVVERVFGPLIGISRGR